MERDLYFKLLFFHNSYNGFAHRRVFKINRIKRCQQMAAKRNLLLLKTPSRLHVLIPTNRFQVA